MTDEKQLGFDFLRGQAERVAQGEMDWAVILAYLTALAAVAFLAVCML